MANMNVIAMVICGFVMITATAFGQVGYTLGQCVKRYGSIVDQDQAPTSNHASRHLAGEHLEAWNRISAFVTLGPNDSLLGNPCQHYEFHKNGIAILVGICKGKVIAVCYVKEDGGSFTSDETNVLLNLNSTGKWNTDEAQSNEKGLVYKGPSDLTAEMPFILPNVYMYFKFVNVYDLSAVVAANDECEAIESKTEKQRNQKALEKTRGL
jgi:hypothetical protein